MIRLVFTLLRGSGFSGDMNIDPVDQFVGTSRIRNHVSHTLMDGVPRGAGKLHLIFHFCMIVQNDISLVVGYFIDQCEVITGSAVGNGCHIAG